MKMESLIHTKGVPQIRAAIGCEYDDDCTGDKICHDSKCICHKDTPILGDQDRCLPLAEVKNACYVSEQCLGNSRCMEGICSCGSEEISLLNPSNKISYCHPKRRLTEECIHDSQCPQNSYCSNSRFGCVCLDGYGEVTVNQSGSLSQECLAKRCQDTSNCESDLYACRDSLCKCLPTHFDIASGKCYKSAGGNESWSTYGNITRTDDGKDSFYSIWKDYMDNNSDRMWLMILILIAATILIVLIVFVLMRKHYRGFCWTAHKKEYEPNNKDKPNYFNKNSINQKSFRQKNDESGNDTDDQNSEIRSNLVSKKNIYSNVSKSDKDDPKRDNSHGSGSFLNHGSSGDKNGRGYVKVNMADSSARQSQPSSEYSPDNHHPRPLPGSTSTPV